MKLITRKNLKYKTRSRLATKILFEIKMIENLYPIDRYFTSEFRSKFSHRPINNTDPTVY
jgi:hypothetical protein